MSYNDPTKTVRNKEEWPLNSLEIGISGRL